MSKPEQSRLANYFTWTAYSLLILSLAAFWQASPGNSSISLGVLVIPLLLFIPGMIRKHNKSYIWLCFALMVYFCKGVSDLFVSEHTALAAAVTITTIMTFMGAFYFVRWQYGDKLPRRKK